MNKAFFIFFFTFFITFHSLKVLGSTPYVRKISYLEGLPTQTIYDLFNDSKGYIYLGTDKGIYRYNGKEFSEIPSVITLSSSINNICEDDEGRIWCKNFSSQLLFLENDSLKTLPDLQKILKESGDLKEFTVVNNELWLATKSSLIKYNIKSKNTEIIFEISHSNYDNFISDVVYDSILNQIYFSDLKSIYTHKINSKNDKVERSDLKEQKLLMMHKGDLFLVSRGVNPYIMNVSKGSILQEDITNAVFYNFLRSTGDYLWLCTNKGLRKITQNDKTIGFDEKFLLLPNHRISDFIKDHEGNFWVSTLDDGLFFIPNLELKTVQVDNEINTFKSNFLSFSYGERESMYVGTSLGKIYHLDTNGVLNKFDTHSNNEISFLFFDTLKNRLYNTFGWVELKNKTLKTDIIFGKRLYPDDQNNFLIANFTMGGLIPQNLDEKVDFPYKINAFDGSKFSSQGIDLRIFKDVRTRSCYYSKKFQKYYFGFSDGLYCFDKNGIATKILYEGSKPIVAYEFEEDSDGNIWVATNHYGMIQIQDDQIVKTINTENGLSSNTCIRFEIDNEILWIITEMGLDKFNLKTNISESVSDGFALRGIGINDVKVSKNNVWLATSEGVLYFSNSIDVGILAPKLFFKGFFVNGLEKKINEVLKYNENDIEIHFNAIHYKSLGNIKIRYRLLGHDDAWKTYDDGINRVNYLALPPGDYKFEVQAFVGSRYSDIQQIDFSINKPFWLTWWFITIETLIGLYLLFIVYKFAATKTRKEQLVREKLALSQITALRSQMNPHFLFNVLNSVQGLIYSNKQNDAAEYLGKFSDLMRNTLEYSNKKVISLDNEIVSLKLYIELESARFEEGFEYNITIDKSIELKEVKIPSMIIQPYVENAIKHGLLHKKSTKKLNIRIEKVYSKNQIKIAIEDNGIGRVASRKINLSRVKHESFATKAIETRLNLLNKTLTHPIKLEIEDKLDENGNSSGTLVELFLSLENC
jgi:ligand-binding sensor domain-containing protein